jgi:chromosome segregation ATPase
MATKEAYRQKLEAQLAEWDARLDVLNARARKASADARIDYENELQGLKRQRERARDTLAELGRRSENAWEDVKTGAERAWDDMASALDKVAARFK